MVTFDLLLYFYTSHKNRITNEPKVQQAKTALT